MDRTEAEASIAKLAVGLVPSEEGISKLLERVSVTDEPAILRDLLVERGARALLLAEAQ